MENGYKEFFDMLCKNLIHDQLNPTIKAEVIWDTLLTDFIPEIVAYAEGKESSDQALENTQAGQHAYILLAKEFPLYHGLANAEGGQETAPKDVHEVYLRSAKVDYLVLKEDYSELVFVELKTTEDSFEQKQYQRYAEYVSGQDRDTDFMWDFYSRVIQAAGKGEAVPKLERSSTQKYMTQIEEIKRKLQQLEKSQKRAELREADFSKPCDVISFLKERTKDANIKLIYLTLTDRKTAGAEICQIPLLNTSKAEGVQENSGLQVNSDLDNYLKETLSESDKSNWELIKKIFKALIEGKAS